jgi:hypothetical protein
MRATTLGALIVTGALASATPVAGQSPVAVPIVGSPAASQPQPPATPSAPPIVPPPAAPNTTFAYPGPPPTAPPTATQAAPAARGARKLNLTFNEGTIGLDAQNVTLREIFTEWQRRGGCQFVNADKLAGGPVTRQFPAGTPEFLALDSLLRDLRTESTGYGYMIAPPDGDKPGNQSMCGAVYILPTSRPTASAAYVPSAGSPIAAPLITGGSPDDEIPPVMPYPPNQPPQLRPNPGQVTPDQTGQQSPTPPPSTPGFGPVAPSAQAPGQRTAQPPGPTGGRGGNQAP